MASNKQLKLQVTNQLNDIAKNIKVNITNVVEDKLLELYKENVTMSFLPRTIPTQKEYTSTNTFLDSIYTEVEDISPTTSTITIMIEDKPYPDSLTGKTAAEIHTYLTEGTNGGGNYPYKNEEDEITYAYNYPTPKHEFEEHTVIQMLGFLDNLEHDIKTGKYNK